MYPPLQGRTEALLYFQASATLGGSFMAGEVLCQARLLAGKFSKCRSATSVDTRYHLRYPARIEFIPSILCMAGCSRGQKPVEGDTLTSCSHVLLRALA